MSNFALGIDVGATKIALATISEKFEVLQKQEVTTRATDANELWQSIEKVAHSFIDAEKGNLFGIGSAGPLDIKA